jgi:hypothetical protein
MPPQIMDSHQRHLAHLMFTLAEVRPAEPITLQQFRGHTTRQAHSGIDRTRPNAGIAAEHRARNSSDVVLGVSDTR